MAGIADILKKTNEILESIFDIPVIDKDIEEDIKRPAFVVDTDEIEIDKYGLMDHISFRLNIYYFAPSIYSGYAELYSVLDRLMRAFYGRIKINDTFNFTLEEQRGTIYRADMAVEMSGKIDIVNPYIEENGTDMLELDVDLKKEVED